MSVMELLASRRTYRRFEQKAVPQDVVEDIIEALRLSSCGANRQAVRLVVDDLRRKGFTLSTEEGAVRGVLTL